MSHIMNLIKISFMLFIAYGVAIAVPPPDRKPCPIALRCSLEPPLAWATDGRNCLVFQNDCHLKSQNCERQNNYEPTFTAASRDDCFKYCRPGCTKEMNPVCTIRNNVSQTFLNPCLWSEQMCKTGEAYVFQFRGSCEPAT